MTTTARPFETTEQRDRDDATARRRAALGRSLSAMGFDLSPYAFEVALARVNALVERDEHVTDLHIRSIAEDVVSSTEILQGVAETFR